MNVSESIIDNLSREVELLTYRLRNIKQSYKTTVNLRLKKRLNNEKNIIYNRVNEILKVSKNIHTHSKEDISLSALLLEISRRSLKEIKSESNLFLF